MTDTLLDQFFTLTPERMLDAVEAALGSNTRATGRTLQLNSMENRVYEIELEDKTPVVVKFYRPGRWSKETILEEHEFIAELAANEVPAVVPQKLTSGTTLGTSQEGIMFAVFPKARGRILQELNQDQLSQVGRYLGRIHNIGAKKPAEHRLRLTTESYGWHPLEFLERSPTMPVEIRSRYRGVVEKLLNTIQPMLSSAPLIRVHGDCHLGNVLWSGHGNEAMQTFFLDFDDMVMAPAVQDIWMVVRGRDEAALTARERLISGYEQMREFDYGQLSLIEPLRTLRIIHYSAWIARRWEDPTFKNAFPEFGSNKYWFEEIATLEEQQELIVAGAPQRYYH